MPSDKFYNLTKEKRKRLIDASRIEFANNDYENVSINKIIQSINMPRGSFYLYFENKEDLYLYILKEYIKEFKMAFINILRKNNGDVFDSMITLYDQIVNDKSYNHKLIERIFLNMNSKQLDFVLPRLMKEEIEGSLTDNINNDNYNFSSNEIEVVLSILMPLLFHAVATSLETVQKNIPRVHYLKQINIIKRGLERKEKC